ncbi:MAG: hypothetical protein SFT92_05725 [Rickettsiales bacterium]|nr:hypothetical protein [Rickettsiales bacterium]
MLSTQHLFIIQQLERDIGPLSDKEKILFEKVAERGSPKLACDVVRIFHQTPENGQPFSDHIEFMKDGSTTSVFDVGGGMVMKIFNENERKSERVHSIYVLEPWDRLNMTDGDHTISLAIYPKLMETSATKEDQDILRYKLWQEGHDLWDRWPSDSHPNEAKNVLRDANGVAFVIDDDAVKDRNQEYSTRTQEAYTAMRENNWDFTRDAVPWDATSPSYLKTMMDKADEMMWPEDQMQYFEPQMDRKLLRHFSACLDQLNQVTGAKRHLAHQVGYGGAAL